MKSPDELNQKILAYAHEKAGQYAQDQKPAPMIFGRWYSLTASACVLMLAVVIVPGQWANYMSQSNGDLGAPALMLEDNRLAQLDDAGVEYNSLEQGEPSMSLITASNHDEIYDEKLVASEPEAEDGPNVNVPVASVRFRARSAPVAMKESVASKNIERISVEQKRDELEIIEQKNTVKKKSEVKKELFAKRKAHAKYKPEPLREQRISAPKMAELDGSAPAENDSVSARLQVVEGVSSERRASAMVAPTINPNTRKVIALEEVLETAVPILTSPHPNAGAQIETLTRIEFNDKFACQLDFSQWKGLQKVDELWNSDRSLEAKIAYAALKFDSCNLPEDEVQTLTNYNFK